MEEFRSMLKEVVEDVPLVQANLLRVNRPYIEFHARIRPIGLDSDFEAQS